MKKLLNVVLVFLLGLVIVIAGVFFYLQNEYGVQISQANPVMKDTCGAVFYRGSVLDFAHYRYANPVIDSGFYQLSVVTDIPVDEAPIGFEILSARCYPKTGVITMALSSWHNITVQPIRLPFVLP